VSGRRRRCRAHLGVGAAASSPSCVTGIGARSGRAHTWGPDSRVAARSGMTHRGPTAERRRGRVDSRAAARSEGQPGSEVLARSGRVCGRVCGHEALSG
jgi:hypothetical protein